MPARNAATTIGSQLAALADQDYGEPWEIIIVDNRSIDETTLVAKQWSAKLPCLRLMDCDAIGANSARNVGLQAARGTVILFCDADDVVASGWVRAMALTLDSYDIVGGRLEYSRLNHPRIQATRRHLATEELPATVGGMRYALGANLGLRRRVFEMVGGFDESFGLGADEIDLCLRAQYAGCTIGFAHEAVVHYRLRESLRGLATQCYSYAIGDAHLYRKHLELQDLEMPGLRNTLQAISGHARRLLRVRGLLRYEESRWAYVGDAASIAGALVGYLRYGVLM